MMMPSSPKELSVLGAAAKLTSETQSRSPSKTPSKSQSQFPSRGHSSQTGPENGADRVSRSTEKDLSMPISLNDDKTGERENKLSNISMETRGILTGPELARYPKLITCLDATGPVAA
ncbi:hypothetical protein PM082_023442 [Marasmius tenuissimus]|nr:hypothetical protein PM082_023442 [Marasmius tenuissimus]